MRDANADRTKRFFTFFTKKWKIKKKTEQQHSTVKRERERMDGERVYCLNFMPKWQILQLTFYKKQKRHKWNDV